MKTLKKYALLIFKFLSFFLIGSFILSIFEYFFLNSNLTHIIGLIYLIILFLVISFKEAKIGSSRGFITGLKIGTLLILTLIFFNIIFFHSHFKFLYFIYYLILLLSSLLGAIIGINTKKEEI